MRAVPQSGRHRLANMPEAAMRQTRRDPSNGFYCIDAALAVPGAPIASLFPSPFPSPFPSLHAATELGPACPSDGGAVRGVGAAGAGAVAIASCTNPGRAGLVLRVIPPRWRPLPPARHLRWRSLADRGGTRWIMVHFHRPVAERTSPGSAECSACAAGRDKSTLRRAGDAALFRTASRGRCVS